MLIKDWRDYLYAIDTIHVYNSHKMELASSSNLDGHIVYKSMEHFFKCRMSFIYARRSVDKKSNLFCFIFLGGLCAVYVLVFLIAKWVVFTIEKRWISSTSLRSICTIFFCTFYCFIGNTWSPQNMCTYVNTIGSFLIMV